MSMQKFSRGARTVCAIWCILNILLLSGSAVHGWSPNARLCLKATVAPPVGGGTCCCDLDYWNECEINYAAGGCTGTCAGGNETPVNGGCLQGGTACTPGVGARIIKTGKWDCDATSSSWSECNTATVAVDCACKFTATGQTTVAVPDCV